MGVQTAHSSLKPSIHLNTRLPFFHFPLLSAQYAIPNQLPFSTNKVIEPFRYQSYSKQQNV